MRTLSPVEQEINRIRLEINEETKVLTREQRIMRTNNIAEAAAKEHGLRRIVSAKDDPRLMNDANSTVLLNRGMECLTEHLGLVDAERFVSLISSESFDYSEWRRENLFQDMTVEEISHAAMQYRHSTRHE